jgi:pyruvate-formate lyase-activating enzyme
MGAPAVLADGHELTGRQLLHFQQQASRHLAFSLTRACPLRCEHCLIATVSPRDQARVTLSIEQARRFADEMSALADAGVERVSFTGGEPLLAPRQLDVLSRAASNAGIGCTVVTACHWSHDEAAAERTVCGRFPQIDTWHLSTDVFHEQFIPSARVLNAARVAVEHGRNVVIRVAVNAPITSEDLALLDRLNADLPEGATIAVQTVVGVGRAESLDVEVAPWRDRSVPCITTGPTIRDDGTVSPCCGSLSDQRAGHPFEYPNAFDRGLAATKAVWDRDLLLMLIRSVGFAPVLDWVARVDPEHPALANTPDHPCDICVALWREPSTVNAVRHWVAQPRVRAQIEALHDRVFNGDAGGE